MPDSGLVDTEAPTDNTAAVAAFMTAPRITDAEWVGLGAIADDAEYYARFDELFGLDIAPTD